MVTVSWQQAMLYSLLLFPFLGLTWQSALTSSVVSQAHDIVCTLESNTTTVSSGDKIVLRCACAASRSLELKYRFYKDQDILEKYEGSDDYSLQHSDDYYNRLQYDTLEHNIGALLTIPYARQRDAGLYECGYTISGEESFVEGSINITVLGEPVVFESSPFGYGKYNITLGIWQDIYLERNGAQVRVPQDTNTLQNTATCVAEFPAVPQALDSAVFSYLFNVSEVPDVQAVISYLPIVNSIYLENWDDYPEVVAFMDIYPKINFDGYDLTFDGEYELFRGFDPSYTVNVSIDYTLHETRSSDLPSYYPTQLSVNVLFPDYHEQVVAPMARYTVLSMAYNDYLPQGFWDKEPSLFIKCVYCIPDSISNEGIKTRCPWGVSRSGQDWTFEDGSAVGTFSDLFEPRQLGNEMRIRKIHMDLGRQYICSFDYVDQTTNKPTRESAKQDIIVEGRRPLQLPNNTELPVQRVVNEPFVLEVYLDVKMRESLYEEIISVRWGRREEEEEETVWLPADYRQLNNWESKWLTYKVEPILSATTFVCHVSYLSREMSIQIPVTVTTKPPPVSDMKHTQTDGALHFTWAPSENEDNNYFIEYSVMMRRRPRTAPDYNGVTPSFTRTVTIPHHHHPNLTVGHTYVPFLDNCVYEVTVVAVYESGKSEARSDSLVTGHVDSTCIALDSTLENVGTDPQLPVEHGTAIVLGCTEGHVNVGGYKASCQNGQIDFTGEPTHCLGLTHMVDRIRATAFKEARDAFVKQLKRPNGPNPSLFSKSWTSRKINRSEDFVKKNWNRDPYDLDD